jgi:hypothetical protein
VSFSQGNLKWEPVKEPHWNCHCLLPKAEVRTEVYRLLPQ